MKSSMQLRDANANKNVFRGFVYCKYCGEPEHIDAGLQGHQCKIEGLLQTVIDLLREKPA